MVKVEFLSGTATDISTFVLFLPLLSAAFSLLPPSCCVLSPPSSLLRSLFPLCCVLSSLLPAALSLRRELKTSEFELHETYVVDILMSTGEGKVWCVRVWGCVRVCKDVSVWSVRGESVECEGVSLSYMRRTLWTFSWAQEREGSGVWGVRVWGCEPRLLIQRQHVNNYEILELAMCLTAFLWWVPILWRTRW